MSVGRPDTTGHTLERAQELLREAGVGVSDVLRVGPTEEHCESVRRFVIRQREAGEDAVELTVAGEWRSPVARELSE